MRNIQDINPLTVLSVLQNGLSLALSKPCRPYIIIPLIINILVMCGGGYLIFTYLNDLIFSLTESLPAFLSFIAYLISVIAAIIIVFVGCYFFSAAATIIASPFYGMLADKAELILAGTASADDNLWGLIKDVPRTLKRELHKQMFFLPLAALCLIITFIPVINLAAPVLWFLLTAWMACLQYADYAYDNHKISFKVMKQDLKDQRLATFVFGAVVSVLLSVPIINLLVPPAAVCAGTNLYTIIQKQKKSAGA